MTRAPNIIRIATYNIEWFDALFDVKGKPLADEDWSQRYKVTRRQQLAAIAHVIRKLDPDLLCIIEAPNTGRRQSTLKALSEFARRYKLRQTHAVMGFANDSDQEIAALYDPTRVTPRHDPIGQSSNGDGDGPAPRFDSAFRLDVDLDGKADIHRFAKPPMELALHLPGGDIRLIGVHIKSKMVHNPGSEKERTATAIINRRKQLAECIWLRARVDQHLDAGDPVIVLGDFNDGPGIDGYEALFGRSSVEIVLGTADAPARQLTDPHAAIRLDPRQGWSQSTARFYVQPRHRYVNAMLDYVMLSPDLVTLARPKWRIWHPFDDPDCYLDEALREALLDASDHFPVSVDLDFSANGG